MTWPNYGKLIDGFFRKRAPAHLPIKIRHRNLYILPTRNGIVFFALLVSMLIGSMNYNNNLGFLLCFLLGSLSFISIFHTHRNVNGVSILSVETDPVFAGETATADIRLDGGVYDRYQLKLIQKDTNSAVTVDANSGKSIFLQLEIPTVQRGLQKFPQLVLQSIYPVGLFYAWAPLYPDRNILVYPAPLPCRIPESLSDDSDESDSVEENDSNRTSAVTDTPDEFAELKTYQPGDPLQRIDWKAYSRGHGLMTKSFTGTQTHPSVMLDWFSLPDVSVEIRLSHLTYLLIMAERHYSAYGLIIPGSTVPPGKGDHHLHTCLRLLAMFQA